MNKLSDSENVSYNPLETIGASNSDDSDLDSKTLKKVFFDKQYFL